MRPPRVDSETGPLREVVLHRPGEELRRLTPANRFDLLFDDLPWVERAQSEHDAFAGLLRSEGVTVHLLEQLLTEALHDDDVRDEAVGALAHPDGRAGRVVADRLAGLLREREPAALAQVMLAGLTVRESGMDEGLVAHVLGPQGFLVPPLPNAVFTRDPLVRVGGAALPARMSRSARSGEQLVWGVLHRHPRLAATERWRMPGDDPAGLHSLEGGDVLVLSPHAVAVGVSERTTPQAVERLALDLFAHGVVEAVLAVVLPRARGTMHLDTVLSVVDHDAVVLWPRAPQVLHAAWVRPAARGAAATATVKPAPDLVAALADGLGVETVRVIAASEDPVLADREQWDDGTNTLALRPGVVVAYERNAATNARLAEAGVQVHTIGSSELPRGRGGPRCMSNPVLRT